MMKKSVLAVVLFSGALSSSVMAQSHVESFIGGGIGYQTDTFKGDVNKHSEDASYQLRAGVIINDHHRLSATYGFKKDRYSIEDDKAKHTQNLFLTSYDYLMPVTSTINLFAGPSMGISHDRISYSNAGAQSASDFVWGGQVGANIQLTNHISSDLTYRYLDQNYKQANTRLKATEQVVWSVDYKF
ncbi:outer membrane beta-barrel protein [Photobacterium phosphoreum]|nr:outer membrane beta-barrel protein [Photobacterium phosphoreum]MCF2177712.1 outer membrane beta-barrel protein [Photobacterium phosphoreum]